MIHFDELSKLMMHELSANLKIDLIELTLVNTGADIQRCSIEKGVLNISQNSQEITCGRVAFLIK